ncbi:related to tripeptidyl-peptidase I [Rhynchosporium agropyri]|uniref:Related to tripeptidyl-peptidase I n=1 Tax=Rhynchosporium agropyri TaxID=914238 RepID=A0A1E1KA62_9HELO|nr:related to tripeptidyl-peptidase I [Rhynchosporium agropyri]
MLGASILLTIAITAEAVLATPVLALSDPDHIRHGHHLSHDKVNELTKPSDEALYLLHEWLEANGVDRASYSPAKDWVNIQISVSTAERLLDTEYHVYKHDDGTEIYRAPTWSLPKHLHEHIDAIQPTTSFMRAIEGREVAVDMTIPWPYPGINEASSPELKKVCTINGTTPDCFATLYKTKGYVQKAAGRNQIGFNNFLGDIPIRPDTKLFLQKYRPEAVSGAADYKFVSIDGGPQQDTGLTPAQATQRISREGNLDVQTIIGITYPMPVVAYTTGGQPPVIPNPPVTGPPENEPFLAWVNYVLSQETIPQVISTSYADDEQTVPLNYAKRVCNGFAQLGARGITLLFATGDTGVGSVARATQGFEPETSAMTPDGAYGPDGKRRGLFVSASGFSEYFPRPSYQDSVVPAYVNSMRGEHTGLFNPNGRVFPDLAAQGQFVKSLWNSTERVVSGTSASAPLMAGVLALVNDELISSGRPTLGFLNSWLYKRGSEAFNDITQGLNGGCNTTGFPTIEGWDAVTGFVLKGSLCPSRERRSRNSLRYSILHGTCGK